MNMRKIVWITCVFFLAALAMLSAAGAQEAKEELIHLKFWKGGMDKNFHDYWLNFINDYESKHPNVTVEYAEAPFGKDLDTKLNAAYASGASPDIISNSIAQISIRSDKGQYEVLDPHLDKWQGKDDILENILELGRYKEKLYGLAYTPIPELFAYRKDFFQEVGLDPEKPPKTWEEFADYAEKLTVREGDIIKRSGLVMPIDGFKLLIPFSVQKGARHVSDDLQPQFTDQATIETLEYLTDLFKTRRVSAEIIQKQENQQSLFLLGQAAMAVVQPTWINNMIKNDPSMKDKVGFFNVTSVRGGVWCGAHLLHISSESDYKAEAWEFIETAMEQEEMWNRYKATGAPTIRKSLAERYKQDYPYMNNALLYTVSVGVGAPKVPWASLYLKKYLPLAQQEAFYGKKTPEQALKDNLELLKKDINK